MEKLHPQLQQISPMEISPDPHNPRGMKEEQIISSAGFSQLLSSIVDHGVLTPLIVRPNESGETNYMLIDGERRWRAAIKTKTELVPVLVAKDDTDARILAYHVQMLFEKWDSAAETKAIKRIVDDIKIKNPKINDGEISRQLKIITALKPRELSERIKLCNYSDEIIEMVVAGDLDKSYLVQIDSSFISPLNRRHANIIKNYGEDKIRKIAVQKAIEGKLVKTRFLMDDFKVVFKDIKYNEKYKEEIEQLLVTFLDKRARSLKKVLEDYYKLAKPRNKKPEGGAPTSTGKTSTQDKGGAKSKKIKLTQEEQTQRDEIRGQFEKIGSSYAESEEEYLKEALDSLEFGCYRAATIMIWAAAMDRIIAYVAKNLDDFNAASKKMKGEKSFKYNYLAKNFKTDAASIDEIRDKIKDRQLLCYLLYKKIIKITQIKALLNDHDVRNDCAHPTELDIVPNRHISIFEHTYKFIFSKNELR